jgi:hypothetical protein
MAEKPIDIVIKTTADTSGAVAAENALKKVETAAKKAESAEQKATSKGFSGQLGSRKSAGVNSGGEAEGIRKLAEATQAYKDSAVTTIPELEKLKNLSADLAEKYKQTATQSDALTTSTGQLAGGVKAVGITALAAAASAASGTLKQLGTDLKEVDTELGETLETVGEVGESVSTIAGTAGTLGAIFGPVGAALGVALGTAYEVGEKFYDETVNQIEAARNSWQEVDKVTGAYLKLREEVGKNKNKEFTESLNALSIAQGEVERKTRAALEAQFAQNEATKILIDAQFKLAEAQVKAQGSTGQISKAEEEKQLALLGQQAAEATEKAGIARAQERSIKAGLDIELASKALDVEEENLRQARVNLEILQQKEATARENAQKFNPKDRSDKARDARGDASEARGALQDAEKTINEAPKVIETLKKKVEEATTKLNETNQLTLIEVGKIEGLANIDSTKKSLEEVTTKLATSQDTLKTVVEDAKTKGDTLAKEVTDSGGKITAQLETSLKTITAALADNKISTDEVQKVVTAIQQLKTSQEGFGNSVIQGLGGAAGAIENQRRKINELVQRFNQQQNSR